MRNHRRSASTDNRIPPRFGSSGVRLGYIEESAPGPALSAGTGEGSAKVIHLAGGIGSAPAADDAGSKRRHFVSIAAAILVEVLALSLFLVKPPEQIQTVDPLIPVEIVAEAAPTPKPEPKIEPKPLPPPPEATSPEPQQPRESGADSNLRQGQKEKAAPKHAVVAPAKKLILASRTKPLPPLDLSLTNMASPVPPAAPASPSPQQPPEQATTSTAPPDSSRIALLNANPLTGEGGGDRYLNSIRDAIVSHLNYPASVRLAHLSGTAEYQIVIDRKGALLGVRLLQSSGSAALDRIGFESIQQAAPFGPPPAEMTGDQIGLVFTANMEPLTF